MYLLDDINVCNLGKRYFILCVNSVQRLSNYKQFWTSLWFISIQVFELDRILRTLNSPLNRTESITFEKVEVHRRESNIYSVIQGI